MPRLRRSLPTYRKHRASGQVIVILSGQDFYLGPTAPRPVNWNTIATSPSGWLAGVVRWIAPATVLKSGMELAGIANRVTRKQK